jgi:hypothetical protein
LKPLRIDVLAKRYLVRYAAIRSLANFVQVVVVEAVEVEVEVEVEIYLINR